MKEILDRFSEANVFCLSLPATLSKVSDYEYNEALNKLKEEDKKELLNKYNGNYGDFDKLYSEIEEECIKFDNEETRKYYIDKHFNEEDVNEFIKLGISSEQIESIKKNFFSFGFIVDNVGISTKYGKEDNHYFYDFYTRVAMNLDRQNSREEYNGDYEVISFVPEELKSELIKYEFSFYNAVTLSSQLMINFYFKLNDNSKKYLLKYNSDFDLDELEDLALYKDEELLFSSCTHERFNSLEE